MERLAKSDPKRSFAAVAHLGGFDGLNDGLHSTQVGRRPTREVISKADVQRRPVLTAVRPSGAFRYLRRRATANIPNEIVVTFASLAQPQGRRLPRCRRAYILAYFRYNIVP